MTKRQRRSQTKRRSTGRPTSGRTVSAAYTKVMRRVITEGPSYLHEKFVRLMQASADLRSEPEFADLYLDPAPLLEAAARHFPRFRRRAKRALRRNAQMAPSVYDDYRIAVLADLDTPELRRELQGRLDRCLDRLKYGNDEAKIEAAVLTSMFLSNEASEILKGRRSIPLGLYGLLTATYENSFDRAMATVPDARERFDPDLYGLWCDRHQEEDLSLIEAAVDRLSAFEDLASRREGNDALALAWRRQKEHLREGLVPCIADGALRIEPSVFSRDEIALATERMEQRHWRKWWSPSRYLIIMAVLNLVSCVRAVLDEIVLPERIARLVEALREVGQSCIASDDPSKRAWVPALQAGIDDLIETQSPSRSRVLQVLYVQELVQTLEDSDTPNPHWQRLIKQLEASPLYRRLSAEDSSTHDTATPVAPSTIR